MKRLFKTLAVAAFLLPLCLCASEDERAVVGEREMSEETKAQYESSREQEAEEAAIVDASESNLAGFIYDALPVVYYPAGCHWLNGVSALGDTLELEDGSVWNISDSHRYSALNWLADDPLVITQNRKWFKWPWSKSYDYLVVNKNTNESIEVNLFLGPIKGGEFTCYIKSIDFARGEIMLHDNSHWEVSSGDAYLLREWATFDPVIIGLNSGWDSACECILINVAMNNFIRAKQF